MFEKILDATFYFTATLVLGSITVLAVTAAVVA